MPIGQATDTVPCPRCHLEAVRVFSPPMTSRLARNVAGLLDHTEKSRYEPDVVTSLPRRPAHQRTPIAPLNPTLQRLPRP
jgi:hypothetical protein